MFEGIVLGIVQGITEWLPVSSEGVLVLVQSVLFGEQGIEGMIELAVVLHLGTALAATVYFRKDIMRLTASLFQWKEASQEQKNILAFLAITTTISGLVGFGLLQLIVFADQYIALTRQALLFIVGSLLFVTGSIQLVAKQAGNKTEEGITLFDSILLGVVQGVAVIPGVSRSGFTVAALLLRKFSNEFALRLSFLMSIPVVLGGSVAVGFQQGLFNSTALWGLLFAFVFGLATIHVLLQLARKIRFGYFVLAFGVITLLAAFI